MGPHTHPGTSQEQRTEAKEVAHQDPWAAWVQEGVDLSWDLDPCRDPWVQDLWVGSFWAHPCRAHRDHRVDRRASWDRRGGGVAYRLHCSLN